MKKNITSTISILLIIYLIIVGFVSIKDNKVKVIKVISPTAFYADINNNRIADPNELIQFYDIDIESPKLKYTDNLKLKYVGLEYCKKILLNKKIKIVKNKNNLNRIILPNGKDYIEELKNEGYIITENNFEKVKKNIDYANTLDLVIYNPISQKYHKTDCPYSQSLQATMLLHKELPSNAQKCKSCYINKETLINKNTTFNSEYKFENITLFTTDFTKYNLPSSKCDTALCKSLLNEINSAQKTIDFAIYGIDQQPQIIQALINAQKRGVKIRWVYDADYQGNTIYKDTLKLNKTLLNNRPDTQLIKKSLSNEKIIKDSIMHNKFFIFDNQKVWTGSANISHTDLSGFNANSVLLINSKLIAEIYKNEFEQMYNGNFHTRKLKQNKSEITIGNSKISVYFSPQDKIIESQIIPLINAAQKYIYIPVFVITHKAFKEALIKAEKRGMEIKIIIDATSASSKYSSVKELRAQNIKIKTENRAGKMHMKSIIIDDKYTVLGSMNFSQSGENYNDENTIIIENSRLAKVFKENFLYLYNSIPNKWLYKNPSAESLDSINSCYDKIDNDFDGYIDSNDSRCKSKN